LPSLILDYYGSFLLREEDFRFADFFMVVFSAAGLAHSEKRKIPE